MNETKKNQSQTSSRENYERNSSWRIEFGENFNSIYGGITKWRME